MNKIKSVIIEDEIPAARLLHTMVKRLRPDWDTEVLPGSIEEAVKWFEGHPHPDILFLDIQLSDGNSFDFLSQARPESIIIFTTAYDEYAVRAFGVNSIDYILKPIDEKRLLDAITKYESMLLRDTPGQRNDYLDHILSSNPQDTGKRYRTRFLISGSEKLWTLQVADIAYFYSTNKITIAVTHKGSEHIIDLSLDKLTDQLDPDLFFRANRQAIIGVDSIKSIEPYFNSKAVVNLLPPAKEKIIISKEKVASFKMWLNF